MSRDLIFDNSLFEIGRGVLYQMKGGADGEWGLWESGVWGLVLGMKTSPASFYGGGWFGFEGLCAALLARTIYAGLLNILSSL